MSEAHDDQERPCLHCMMVELIDDFFAEYPATPSGSDKVDTDETDEVCGYRQDVRRTNLPPRRRDPPAIKLTCRQDGVIRQQLIEQLMREIINYDAEFRRDDQAVAVSSHARH